LRFALLEKGIVLMTNTNGDLKIQTFKNLANLWAGLKIENKEIGYFRFFGAWCRTLYVAAWIVLIPKAGFLSTIFGIRPRKPIVSAIGVREMQKVLVTNKRLLMRKKVNGLLR